MKVTCRISGLPLRKVEQFTDLETWGLHPIFLLEEKKLLSDWSRKKFNTTQDPKEQFLLFLAVANTTGLVTWHVPVARLPMQAIISKFHIMLDMALMIRSNRRASEVYPSFICDKDNNAEGIFGWLESLVEIKTTQRLAAVAIAKEQADKEAASKFASDIVSAEIGALTDVEDYRFSKRLALWAVDVCEASTVKKVKLSKRNAKGELEVHHIPQRNFLYQFLITKREDWYLLPDHQIKQVLEWFETNLPYHGWPASHALLKRLRDMLEYKNSSNSLFELIGGEDLPTYASQVEVEKATKAEEVKQLVKEITQELAAEANVEVSAEVNQEVNQTSTCEPKQEDYPSKTAWLLAKAKWLLEQKGKGN